MHFLRLRWLWLCIRYAAADATNNFQWMTGCVAEAIMLKALMAARRRKTCER